VLLVVLPLLAGCPENGPTCTERRTERNLTGSWVFTLTPDGNDTIPRPTQIFAELLQVLPDSPSTARFVYGTLTAGDKEFFGAVSIPSLMQNNGSKTGVVLGCDLAINVPIASPVTDDNNDQGPLRIRLSGTIVGQTTLKGDPDQSRLIMESETPPKPRRFAWTAEEQ
jgi:hypothetical protein